MRKRHTMVTIALVLGLVLLVGFHVLAASGAPHKQGKHLADKSPEAATAKLDKHLSDKSGVSAQGLAMVVGWGMMSTVVVGALLAPWTMEQIGEVRDMYNAL